MNNKKVVRLTESQLHNIIAESVNQILKEFDYDIPQGSKRKGWNEPSRKRPERFDGDKYWEDEPNPNLRDGDYFMESIDEAKSQGEYAYNAGKASGALNTMGGKLKGLFNPKWKERKQRQEKLFADAAVGNGFTQQYSNGRVGMFSGDNLDTPYQNDYYHHSFKKGNKSEHGNETPFIMKRSQGDGDASNFVPGSQHGKEISYTDFMRNRGQDRYIGRNNFNQYKDSGNWDKDSNFADMHSELNRNYRKGKRDSMGRN